MADYTKQGPFIEDAAPPVGPAQLNAFDDAIKDAAEHNRYGTLAARPAAAATNKGHIYWAYDTGQQFRSNGVSWDELASLQLPTAGEKAALATRLGGPSWNVPGLGYQPPPGSGNRYLAEVDRAIKFYDIPSAGGGTVDFWPGDGYWMVKSVYGFHYDANLTSTALIGCVRGTFDGATRRISIRDQWTAAYNVSVTFSVVNPDTTSAVIRATASHGNTRIFLWEYRGQPSP